MSGCCILIVCVLYVSLVSARRPPSSLLYFPSSITHHTSYARPRTQYVSTYCTHHSFSLHHNIIITNHTIIHPSPPSPRADLAHHNHTSVAIRQLALNILTFVYHYTGAPSYNSNYEEAKTAALFTTSTPFIDVVNSIMASACDRFNYSNTDSCICSQYSCTQQKVFATSVFGRSATSASHANATINSGWQAAVLHISCVSQHLTKQTICTRTWASINRFIGRR